MSLLRCTDFNKSWRPSRWWLGFLVYATDKKDDYSYIIFVHLKRTDLKIVNLRLFYDWKWVASRVRVPATACTGSATSCTSTTRRPPLTPSGRSKNSTELQTAMSKQKFCVSIEDLKFPKLFWFDILIIVTDMLVINSIFVILVLMVLIL